VYSFLPLVVVVVIFVVVAVVFSSLPCTSFQPDPKKADPKAAAAPVAAVASDVKQTVVAININAEVVSPPSLALRDFVVCTSARLSGYFRLLTADFPVVGVASSCEQVLCCCFARICFFVFCFNLKIVVHLGKMLGCCWLAGWHSVNLLDFFVYRKETIRPVVEGAATARTMSPHKSRFPFVM
jgi:hypothetical protein